MSEWNADQRIEYGKVVDEVVITHGGSERAYRKCRCSKCGLTARCTLFCDFYTLPSDQNGPLFCERCIRS